MQRCLFNSGEIKMNTETENQNDTDITLQKLADANIPGFIVDVDSDEADLLGAFVEDALTEQDAMDGGVDLVEVDIDNSHLNKRVAWGLA
jgi:hypothetical protein